MLVKYGGGIIDARGSMAGNVFSRNRYGAYVRARTTPINPNTTRQSDIRAIVSDIAMKWLLLLTQLQRDAWAVFAANVPTTNKLGETIHLSGFNQYMKSNIAAANAGGIFIDDAPIIFTLPGEDTVYSVAVDSATGKITITFDATNSWTSEDNGFLIVQAGIPVSASHTFFGGPWRHAGVVAGDGAIPATSPNADIDYPYVLGAGQKVTVRAKILRADGRLSDWFRDDGIVT